MRAAVPPPRAVHGELAQLGAQRGIVISALGLIALGRAMLPDYPAGPALADAKAVTKHRDRPTPAGWAYQFPRLISFNARTSSA